MRLLAFGDLHLGAGTALGRDPGDRLRDQADVLDRIAEIAMERQVDAILDAGDTFEGPLVTPEQLDVFAAFIDDVCRPVVAVSGNGKHDSAMRSVNGVHIFNRLAGSARAFSRPGLIDLGGVQVACLPWVSPGRLVASMDGDVDRDRINQRAAELLVKVADGLADPQVKPTVLMLHGSISGASLPAGIATDELREPVIPVEDLLDLGYAAIVAGHIHVPQFYDCDDGWDSPHASGYQITRDGLALYTGSPLPLNFGEASVPHGVWILDVDKDETHAEFVPIESRPLFQYETELNDLAVADVGLDALPEIGLADLPDGAIAKIKIRGTAAQVRRLDLPAIRSALLSEGAHTVKIEVETVRHDRARAATVTEDLDPLDAFDAWAEVNGTGIDPDDISRAREQMQADLEAVGA